MQVIVRGRREGKTTELVKWLLEGEVRASRYPAWSRVIVSTNASMVQYTQRMVQGAIAERGGTWLCRKSRSHIAGACIAVHRTLRANIAKSIWLPKELSFNIQGSELEYAIDDAEEFLFGRDALHTTYPPAIITMSGELYVPK